MNRSNHRFHCSCNRIRVALESPTLGTPPEREGGDGP